MTIRRLVQGIFAVLTLVAVVTALFIWGAAVRRRSLVELQQRRFASYRLANELRQSSNDLTRFARMYVATGDARYEQIYHDVLAIRDGTKARPEHYDGAYWDLFIADFTAPHPAGPAASLRELMRREHFSEDELTLLTQSESVSNTLVGVEELAMHAVKGEFRDSAGRFTRTGPPDRALANRLMYDSTYVREKARIMKPIDEFLAMVDARTSRDWDDFNHSTQVAFATIEGLLLVFLALVLMSYPILRNRILVPVTVLQGHTRQVARDLDRLAGATKDIALGDLAQSYAVDTAPIKSTRPDEIGDLSRLHDEMILQLQSAGASIASITADLKSADVVNRQRFEAIFQASPVPLAVSIAETGKIVEANKKALEHLAAKTPEDLIGKSTIELGVWAPAQREKILEGITRNGRLEALPVSMRRLDGKELKVELWSTYYVAGGVRYLLTSTIDVTARHLLEEQLRQSQKMESMGRLAGGIAHDFNNLLTVIIGYGQMVMTQLPKADRSTADVQEMVKAAERAAEMTRQLLVFARKQVVEMKDLNLNGVLANVEKMLKRMIGDDVVLKTAHATDLGTIRSDAGQLEQIVANLSLNARDAMPTGGTITMTTANVVVGDDFVAANPQAKAGEFVRLSVADSGTGIDPAIMPRIFEPFFTTKEVGKGTGLGLSTVFGIVEQNQGFVVVDSVVGRGTIFHLFFPLVGQSASGALGRADATPSLGGKETILIAEDNAVLRDLMTRVLSDRGYYVLSTDGGEAALKVSDQFTSRIDLLLTDVVMPGMSGRTLAEGLVRTRPNVKVLYVSGYPDEVLGRHGALDANIRLLPKPFTPEGLASKVREVLDTKAV